MVRSLRPFATFSLALAGIAAAGNATAFTGGVHEAVTLEAAAAEGYDTASAKKLVAGNLMTDNDPTLFNTPEAHFDSEMFSKGSKRLRDKFEATMVDVANRDRNQALEDVGTSLH